MTEADDRCTRGVERNLWDAETEDPEYRDTVAAVLYSNGKEWDLWFKAEAEAKAAEAAVPEALDILNKAKAARSEAAKAWEAWSEARENSYAAVRERWWQSVIDLKTKGAGDG